MKNSIIIFAFCNKKFPPYSNISSVHIITNRGSYFKKKKKKASKERHNPPVRTKSGSESAATYEIKT